MTAKQLMDFAEKHSQDKDMFESIKEEINAERYQLLIKLEQEPDDKKLKRLYLDTYDKERMIQIMSTQRMELLRQSKLI